MHNHDDARMLTRAIASGDTEAFAVFYQAWFDHTYQLACSYTRRDESFCLDVVQDVFVRAIDRMPELETDASIGAWLRTVVRSCAADRIRADRARHNRDVTGGSLRSREPVDPIDTLIHCEQVACLRAGMEHVSISSRSAFMLRFQLGRTLSQIGVILGLSPSAVDGRVNRAIAAVRREQEVGDD